MSLGPPIRSDMKNSARLGTNTSTQPVSMPGAVSGSVTVQNTFDGRAPISRPASTSDQSIFSTLV